MVGLFYREGLDLQEKTIVVEIRRDILAPIANLLQFAPDSGRNNLHFAIRKLGECFRNAARVLYDEVEPERFGFNILDPVEEIEEKDRIPIVEMRR